MQAPAQNQQDALRAGAKGIRAPSRGKSEPEPLGFNLDLRPPGMLGFNLIFS